MSVIYIDGEFVDAADASIPVTDVALLRGYAVFDFLRTYGGTPFQLSAHLQRLLTSAALIDLSCPWDIEELAEIALSTMRRNGHPESNIHIILTGGDSDGGFLPRGEPRLLVMAPPWEAPPGWWYKQGVHAVTTELHRHLPQAKTINYVPGISAQLKSAGRKTPRRSKRSTWRTGWSARARAATSSSSRRPLDHAGRWTAARHHPRRSHQAAERRRLAGTARRHAGRRLRRRRSHPDINHQRSAALGPG